jgi:3'(2'), 5'-bisphosphate nucleotidase
MDARLIDKTGEYAVHIALVHQGRPILAVVAWPEAEKLYYATLGGGTFVETRESVITPVRVSKRDAMRMCPLLPVAPIEMNALTNSCANYPSKRNTTSVASAAKLSQLLNSKQTFTSPYREICS